MPGYGTQQPPLGMGGGGTMGMQAGPPNNTFMQYLPQAQQAYGMLGGDYSPSNVMSLALNLQKQGAGGGMTATQAQALRKLGSAEQFLANYEDLIARTNPAGNPLLARLGGPLKELTGRIGLNPASDEYRRYAEGSASLFLKSLGESGTLSDADVSRAAQMLPSLNQSQEEVARNIQRLRQMIQTNKQNVMSIGGGAQTPAMDYMQGYGY